ncbi:hypothetical protein QF047_003474 [Arthrobacter sp. W4I7]|nr:hypothetical protein [Arthrobacter sp. W4I7]
MAPHVPAVPPRLISKTAHQFTNRPKGEIKLQAARHLPDRLQLSLLTNVVPEPYAGWKAPMASSVISALLQALVGWGRNSDAVSSGG